MDHDLDHQCYTVGSEGVILQLERTLIPGIDIGRSCYEQSVAISLARIADALEKIANRGL